MSEEKIKKGKIDFSNLSRLQLMEVDACTRCGECVKWCPVYVFDKNENITPRGKLRKLKIIINAQNSLLLKILRPDSFIGGLLCPEPVSDEYIRKFAENLYECSTCRQCHFVCPSNIDTVELYEAIRRSIINAGFGPLDTQLGLITSTKSYDNPWQQPRSHRAKWTRTAKMAGRIDEIPIMLKPQMDE